MFSSVSSWLLTFRDTLSVSSSRVDQKSFSWNGCNNHQSTLRNVPEEQRPQIYQVSVPQNISLRHIETCLIIPSPVWPSMWSFPKWSSDGIIQRLTYPFPEPSCMRYNILNLIYQQYVYIPTLPIRKFLCRTVYDVRFPTKCFNLAFLIDICINFLLQDFTLSVDGNQLKYFPAFLNSERLITVVKKHVILSHLNYFNCIITTFFPNLKFNIFHPCMIYQMFVLAKSHYEG
jgi:hypothetical protein